MLKLELPAQGEYLLEIRHLIYACACSLGASEAKAADIVLAIHEACSNVVAHAYGEEDGPLRLEASQQPGRLVIEVSDKGTPVADPAGRAGAGLGLGIIRAVCDEVAIDRPGRYGTRLEMTFTLI